MHTVPVQTFACLFSGDTAGECLAEAGLETILARIRQRMATFLVGIVSEWRHVGDSFWTTSNGIVLPGPNGTMQVKYDNDRTTYKFPTDGIEYRNVKPFFRSRKNMSQQQDTLVEDDLHVAPLEPPQAVAEGPTEFKFFEVRTWAPYMESSSSLDLLELRLSQHYGVHARSSARRKQAMDALMRWSKACSEVDNWGAGTMPALGDVLLMQLREVISEESGVDMPKLHSKLAKVLNPEDKYGVAVAEVEKTAKAVSRPQSPRRR